MIEKTQLPLHLLEGFFGRTWSWRTRRDLLPVLRDAGFQSYIYAPKDDAILRRQWHDDWADNVAQQLQNTVRACHDNGMQFGIGLSPFEIYCDFNGPVREKLKQKVHRLNNLQPDILCLLFDDMRGDMPGLAQAQAQIAHFVAEHSKAKRLVMCPTYYSTDPILEQVFGERPATYWEDLGTELDKTIDLFWTGEQVCSTNYSAEHLISVGELLQRKPFLWDNYPVNDGAKTSRFVNLRAFEGRDAVPEHASGHAINPMNQPWLSQISLHSLAASYQQADYNPRIAFSDACRALCGSAMASALNDDLPTLQDVGLDEMDATTKAHLRKRYAGFLNDAQAAPFATEIVDWIDEQYLFDPACLTG
jgi:hypothetical protein